MTKDNTHLPLRHKTFSRGTTKTSLHGAITKKRLSNAFVEQPLFIISRKLYIKSYF